MTTCTHKDAYRCGTCYGAARNYTRTGLARCMDCDGTGRPGLNGVLCRAAWAKAAVSVNRTSTHVASDYWLRRVR